MTVHRGDLLEAGVARALVQRIAPSHLLHLAWYLAPGQVWNSLENVRWTEATLALVRAFADTGGKRAVVAGTCSEYSPSAEPCSEATTPTRPATLYGASKDAVRTLAEMVADQGGLSLAWPRIFFAYGPHEHPARLVASITRNLLLGRPAPCSHGRQVRDYLYTPDIANALVALLSSPVEGPVNVASGNPASLRDVIEHIGRSVGRLELVRFGEVESPVDEPPVLTADVRRLREEVGWRPAHSLEEGLERTIQWWRLHTDECGAAEFRGHLSGSAVRESDPSE